MIPAKMYSFAVCSQFCGETCDLAAHILVLMEGVFNVHYFDSPFFVICQQTQLI